MFDVAAGVSTRALKGRCPSQNDAIMKWLTPCLLRRFGLCLLFPPRDSKSAESDMRVNLSSEAAIFPLILNRPPFTPQSMPHRITVFI